MSFWTKEDIDAVNKRSWWTPGVTTIALMYWLCCVVYLPLVAVGLYAGHYWTAALYLLISTLWFTSVVQMRQRERSVRGMAEYLAKRS